MSETDDQEKHLADADIEKLVAELDYESCGISTLQFNLEQNVRSYLSELESVFAKKYREASGHSIIPGRALKLIKIKALQTFRDKNWKPLGLKLGKTIKNPTWEF